MQPISILTPLATRTLARSSNRTARKKTILVSSLLPPIWFLGTGLIHPTATLTPIEITPEDNGKDDTTKISCGANYTRENTIGEFETAHCDTAEDNPDLLAPD